MKLNQLKAGAVISYTSMVLGYLISIVYTPLMLRLLGQSEYGLYSLVASVVSYLGILNFGFGSAYIRYYTIFKVKDDKINTAKLNGMFLLIFSLIGFLALVAGLILTVNSDAILGNKLTDLELSKARILIFIMIINVALSFPGIVFRSHITANERFILLKLSEIVKLIVNPFLILPILFMGYGSVGMVIVTTIIHITVDIVYIYYCFKKLKIKFIFKGFDRSLLKETVVFSSYIFMNIIVDQVNWNVDKFILGRFHGTVAVAVFGLSSQLRSYYRSISTTISNLFIPRINQIVSKTNDNNELTLLMTKVGRVQFFFLCLIMTGLLFFGRVFVNIWAGKDYDRSFIILMIMLIPLTVPLIQNVGIEIQRAKNMHKFRSWVFLALAFFNILITLPLAKRFEGIGSAIGTAVSIIIGNGLIMNWYYHYRVKLDMKFFWKEILKILPSITPPLIAGFLLYRTLDLYNIRIFISSAFAYTTVFVFSVWLYGFNKYEKDLFGKPVLSLLRKFKILRK